MSEAEDVAAMIEMLPWRQLRLDHERRQAGDTEKQSTSIAGSEVRLATECYHSNKMVVAAEGAGVAVGMLRMQMVVEVKECSEARGCTRKKQTDEERGSTRTDQRHALTRTQPLSLHHPFKKKGA
jgi:hypothetical protein